jgi:leucyl-tRNA synthetase
VYNLFFENKDITITDSLNDISNEFDVAYNVFVKNIQQHLDEFKHNLAVSDMMIYVNACYQNKKLCKPHVKGFLVALSCFAPHLAEEIYEHVFKTNNSISKEK